MQFKTGDKIKCGSITGEYRGAYTEGVVIIQVGSVLHYVPEENVQKDDSPTDYLHTIARG